MKTKHTPAFNSLTILGILALSAPWAAGQLPTGTSFKMNAGTVENIGQVEIADPGNHSWKLQSIYVDFHSFVKPNFDRALKSMSLAKVMILNDCKSY